MKLVRIIIGSILVFLGLSASAAGISAVLWVVAFTAVGLFIIFK